MDDSGAQQEVLDLLGQIIDGANNNADVAQEEPSQVDDLSGQQEVSKRLQQVIDDVVEGPNQDVPDELNGQQDKTKADKECQTDFQEVGRTRTKRESFSEFSFTLSVRFLPKFDQKGPALKEETSEVFLKVADLQGARSHESSPKVLKFPSRISVTLSRLQRNMQETMDSTVKVLEEKLQRMVVDYGTKSELDKEIQCSSFADHVDGGDCVGLRRPSVLCECGCAGPSGGAAPRLSDPSALSIRVIFSKSKRDDEILPLAIKAHLLPVKRGVQSASDLIERVIRLPVTGKKCRCTKSMTNNKCAGFRADRTIRASAPMQTGLLVEQDDDYADEYLELLGQDQVGTQTDFNDLERAEAYLTKVRSQIDRLADSTRCTCYGSVEMPWDLLTYSPQDQQKNPHSSKRLTVATIDQEALFNITKHPVEDDLGGAAGQDRSYAPAKKSGSVTSPRRSGSGSFAKKTGSATAAKASGSGTSQKKSVLVSDSGTFRKESSREAYYPPKVVPHQVFESDEECPHYNEPYMEKLYTYFQDDGCANDSCPPRVEMPWNSIELPRNIQIRKMYKPPPEKKSCKAAKKTRRKPPRREQRGMEVKVSLSEMESLISIQPSINLFLKAPKKSKKRQQQCKSASSVGSSLMCSTDVSKEAKSVPMIAAKCKRNSCKNGENSDRMSKLLESCKREMEPIKQEINKLRTRIRELNLPDVYSEYPQRLSGAAPCTYMPSYMSLVSSNLDFPYSYSLQVPCWPPYIPTYIPPTCPVLPYYPSPPRTASKLSLTHKASGGSYSTSISVESAPRKRPRSKKATPDNCTPKQCPAKKKPTPSKIPVPCSQRSASPPLKRCGCKIKKAPSKQEAQSGPPNKEVDDSGCCCSKSVATSKQSVSCVNKQTEYPTNDKLLLNRFLDDVVTRPPSRADNRSEAAPSTHGERDVIVKSKVVFDIAKVMNKYKKATAEQGCSCENLH